MNQDPRTPPPVSASAAALALLAATLWGGTAVAVKFTEETLPPLAIATIRFSLAAASIALWCRLTHTQLALARHEIRPALIVSCFLFVQIWLFNLGVQWSNASHGTVLINVYIFFVIALEHFVTRTDAITWRKSTGLLLAAMGVLLTMVAAGDSNGFTPPTNMDDMPGLLGDLILVVSALILGVKIVYTKLAVAQVAPVKLVFWQHLYASVLFAVTSVLVEGTDHFHLSPFTTPVIIGLLFQGVIVGAVCFVIQTALLRRHSATQISVFNFITPLAGVIFAVALRGDQLAPSLLAAGLAIAAAIYLVTTTSPRNTLAADPVGGSAKR